MMKYYYRCKTCKAVWMQFPPDSKHVQEGGDPEITFPRQKRSKQYTCSKCGLPKKGHICKANSSAAEERSSELFSQNHEDEDKEIKLPPLSSFTVSSSNLSLDSHSLSTDAFDDVFAAASNLC